MTVEIKHCPNECSPSKDYCPGVFISWLLTICWMVGNIFQKVFTVLGFGEKVLKLTNSIIAGTPTDLILRSNLD